MRRFYFMPRIILAFLAVLFGWLAINPLIHQKIVRAVHATTGAKTTISDVKTSWRDRTVKLSKFAIADPYQNGETLIRADSVNLELDRNALLRRRTVVKRGRVSGLRLGSTQGRIEVLTPERIAAYEHGVAERFQRVSGHWLSRAAEHVKSGLPTEIKSADLATQIETRWPAANQQIQSNASQLLERAIAIRKQIEKSGQNRLRNLAAYQAAIGDIEKLAHEINEVERHTSQLQQQMRMDREAMLAANQQDADALTQQTGLASLDPDALSDYLVGAEVSESLAHVLHWVASVSYTHLTLPTKA